MVIAAVIINIVTLTAAPNIIVFNKVISIKVIIVLSHLRFPVVVVITVLSHPNPKYPVVVVAVVVTAIIHSESQLFAIPTKPYWKNRRGSGSTSTSLPAPTL